MGRGLNHPTRHGGGLGGFGGADDRRITRAAAQIARQHIVVVGASLCVSDRHRHDEPRRAKAALAAVVFNHRGLNRVQGAVRPGYALNRAHGFAVQLRQE